MLCVKVVRPCPGAGSGTDWLLCEARPGLPHAGHSQFQPAPMGPTWGTAVPSTQNGAPWGNIFEKDSKCCMAVESEEQSTRKNFVSNNIRERGRERRRCSRCCSRASQYSLGRAHTGAVDKSVEVEATGTNCYGPTATHSPAPLRARERS